MPEKLLSDINQLHELTGYLGSYLSESRSNLFAKVLSQRTRYITVVLEDIYQSHNASAILRTCECTGVQDVYIIENRYEYSLNPNVVMGSSKWIGQHKFSGGDDNTTECLAHLKSKGYRILATTPHHEDKLLEDVDIFAGPFALVFGTEKEGLTQKAKQMADEFVKIPMHGFTESYNISVSAALSLFYFTQKLRKSGIHWQLSEIESLQLKLEWLRSSIRSCDLIEQRYFEKKLPGIVH